MYKENMRHQTEVLFRLFITIVGFIILVMGMVSSTYAAGRSMDLSKKNLIYMAYDDSGSMYRDLRNMDGFHPLVRWSQAKYALEVFSSMMLEKDEMYIYPLQEYGLREKGPSEEETERYIHLVGTTSPQERLNQIETHEFWYGQNTAYHSVKKAYEDLLKENDSDTERWLVILTDGAFDRDFGTDDVVEISKSELDSRFSSYAKSGIHVVFLRIFDEEGNTDETPTNKPEEGIYVYEARKSEDTLERLNEISNLIFKRQVLTEQAGQISKGDGSIDISLDAPAGQLVVFAQGKGVNVESLSGERVGVVPPSDVITIGSPRMPEGGTDGKLKGSTSWTRDNLERDENLGCTLATFDLSGNPAIGKLHIPMSNTANLSVYVRPAVKPVVMVMQGGKPFYSGDALKEGEAEIVVTLVNSVTGDELDMSSAILSGIKYDGIQINGEPWNPENGRQTVTLDSEEGVLTVTGFVTIEQSSYEMEETIFHIKKRIMFGELALNGDVKQVLADDLENGNSPVAVTFEIQENGTAMSSDKSSVAQVEVKTDNTDVSAEPIWNDKEGKWEILISCDDKDALFGGEKSMAIKLDASVHVKSEDDDQIVTGYWTISLTDPDYVGEITISDLTQTLDGETLYQSINSGEAELKPFITFTISEEENEEKVTPQNAIVSCAVTCTQQEKGLSLTQPAYNSETKVYEIFLLCESGNIKKLDHDGANVIVSYQINASADRGDGKKDAEPVNGSFSFIDPEHVGNIKITNVTRSLDGEDLYQVIISDKASLTPFLTFTITEEESEGKVSPKNAVVTCSAKCTQEEKGLSLSQPVYNEEMEVYEIFLICESDNIKNLDHDGSIITASFQINASVDRGGEVKSAEPFEGSLSFEDYRYVGDIQITDVKHTLDGEELYEAIRTGATLSRPCLTFTITEEKEGKGSKLTPENASISCEVKSIQEGGRISFTEPVYNVKTGVFDVFINCSTDDLYTLKYEGCEATVPYQIDASVNRGGDAKCADSFTGSFTFENPIIVQSENFKLIIEPPEGIELVYQELVNNPDSSEYFTVRVMNGDKDLPLELMEKVKLTPTAENDDFVTLEVLKSEGSTMIVKPRLTKNDIPDFSDGTIIASVDFQAELDRGDLEPYVASSTGSLRLSLAEPGVSVSIKNPGVYSMQTMALSEEAALNQDSFIEVLVTKDSMPLTEEEWKNFELTKDIHFVSNKDKELKEDTAAKVSRLHLAYRIFPEESKILIYPWAEANDLVRIGSLTVFPGFTWRYTDCGVVGKEHSEHGEIHIKGLPWYVIIWEWLKKYWMFVLPALIVLYILSRYVPKEWVRIFGRYYGLSLRKKTKSIKNVFIPINHINIQNEEVTLKFRKDLSSILCFWRDILWTIAFTTPDGRDVEVKVNQKTGLISLTEDSYSTLASFKYEGRNLVVWGAGGAAGKTDLIYMPKETVLKDTSHFNLRFRFADVPRNKKYTDLKVKI